MTIIEILAQELNLKPDQVERTVALIDEGNTIPFIARYRKEVTGSLDDTVLRQLDERLTYLRNMEARREEIRNLIAAQEKLTPEIEQAIAAAKTMTELEDIYRPFRPHRKTRASIAREKGLEPLAALLMAQNPAYEPDLDTQADGFINEEKGVKTREEAYAGACDIIAEDISDNAEYRKIIRARTYEFGTLASKGEGESVYTQYYEYEEKINKVPGHRILAINRGEKEDFLKVSVNVPADLILNELFAHVIAENDSPARKYVSGAIVDSYERLIAPSVEREIRNDMFEKASDGAIKVFADNLKHLLMTAPLKGKVVLGYDPGYRTGCKLAVVDKTGKVLETGVIYPTKPQERIQESGEAVKRLIRRWGVNVIAIGNGTASKESEIFIANLLREIPEEVK